MSDKGKNIARCEYTVSEAENGYIFSYYDIAKDGTEYWVAKTPEELGEIILLWQQDRIDGMLKYQTGKQK